MKSGRDCKNKTFAAELKRAHTKSDIGDDVGCVCGEVRAEEKEDFFSRDLRVSNLIRKRLKKTFLMSEVCQKNERKYLKF